MALQQYRDMTDVEAPSSKTVRRIVFPEILVDIWKANLCESLVLKSSSLKAMMLLFLGFIAPSVVSNFFRWVGQVWSTSRGDIAHGAWAKSSTIL